jgi:SAM-dependent methyltransferase
VSLKDGFIRALWGERFYRSVLQPLDRWLIEPVVSASLDSQDLPLNKACRVADAGNASWRRGYDDLGFPANVDRFHRKIWEFNQTLYGLRKLRRLAPDAAALGIGCGHEELMYFLANRIASVVATDLYEGSYIGGESDADVLEHPAKYAPFTYREDHLQVRRMNGLALDAADATFDFAFCLSSIEHFGTIGDKQQALREMFRVLKPGGVAVVTTEIVLNRLGRGRQYFSAGVLSRLVAEAGFTLDQQPDLRVEREYAERPLALPMDTFTTPHVVLRNFNTIYTSVALFLMKASGGDTTRNAIVGDEAVIATEPYRYAAEFRFDGRPAQLRPGEPINITVRIRNSGNATWFAGGDRSHVVRVGAWWSGSNGRNIGGEPQRAPLPGHVRPGEEFPLTLSVVAPVDVTGVQLRLGLVKEKCFWFRDRGGADVTVPLDTQPR